MSKMNMTYSEALFSVDKATSIYIKTDLWSVEFLSISLIACIEQGHDFNDRCTHT